MLQPYTCVYSRAEFLRRANILKYSINKSQWIKTKETQLNEVLSDALPSSDLGMQLLLLLDDSWPQVAPLIYRFNATLVPILLRLNAHLPIAHNKKMEIRLLYLGSGMLMVDLIGLLGKSRWEGQFVSVGLAPLPSPIMCLGKCCSQVITPVTLGHYW